ncbi:MAG: fumarylacetoacetase [Gemmataceae bacterium]
MAGDLRSFLPVPPESHFPIQNLPFGAFRRGQEAPRLGVRIGDWALDLSILAEQALLDGLGLDAAVFCQPVLNDFLALGRPAWRRTRERLQELLRHDSATLRDNARLCDRALIPINDIEMLLPARIENYTDFYSSREHATNVGKMLRPDNPLLPNWLHLPVAYHGRASSIVVSGTDIRRPLGQTKADDAPAPSFGPSHNLDFELEMGVLVGPGNALGQPVPVRAAAEHLFGMVLVNDWSARDIQKWEYQPLGPFLSKNFATSISPWVVTLDALEPFRVEGQAQDPPPLPYLKSEGPWAYDIRLEVYLQTKGMSERVRIAESNARHLYWNICQQLAHHTINGCNLRPGDLLASGTISGPDPGSYGSLLELTWRGSKPIQLPSGETRRFLEDGDALTLTGYCQGEGFRVGLGEVTGRVLAALNWAAE